MTSLDELLEHLVALPAPDDAEHLYADRGLRLTNLRRYLESVEGTDTALIAEAPGWRGMTNTGIPFVSVRELGPQYERPAQPTALWEASSRVVQAALADWAAPLPVCWPIYPHHPFLAPDPHTNRTPRATEVAAGAPLTLELLDAFGITRVIAVGRKAQGALAAAGIDSIAVRHPAQGGATLFTQQLRELM